MNKYHSSDSLHQKPDLSVILLNYNSSQFTVRCIDSIGRGMEDSDKIQIILVDNASEANDKKQLELYLKQYPEIKYIESSSNLGFSGGLMLGIPYVLSDYILFLNNDTELLHDCLSILLRFMRTHPEAGLCTGQMYNEAHQPVPSFNYFPSLSLKILGASTLRLFFPKNYPSRKKIYLKPLSVDFVTGAAMLVHTPKFLSLGGLDTEYFLYCEEEDLGMRMHLKGYEVYFIPEAGFIHHSGKSTVRNERIEREYYISLMRYHRKFDPLWKVWCFRLLYSFKNFRKFYKGLHYLKRGFFILKGADSTKSIRYQKNGMQIK